MKTIEYIYLGLFLLSLFLCVITICLLIQNKQEQRRIIELETKVNYYRFLLSLF